MLDLDTQLRIEGFLKTVEQAPRSLLLLDYDGTLAPFRVMRDRAFPYPGIARAVQEIVSSGRTRVVIVSGRDVNETVPLLGVAPVPEVWGLHGLQRRRPDGSIEMIRIDVGDLDALSAAEQWLNDQHMRQKAEIKTGSIAVHWRGATNHEIERWRGRVLAGWRPIADGSRLELLDFDGGVEIRVPEVNKGDVVRTVLREMETGIPAAYLGDDHTDEAAFNAINGLGLSALVRARLRHTAAQVWLKPPEEVFEFLTDWAVAIRTVDATAGRPASAVVGR